jgi:hypothetical protein
VKGPSPVVGESDGGFDALADDIGNDNDDVEDDHDDDDDDEELNAETGGPDESEESLSMPLGGTKYKFFPGIAILNLSHGISSSKWFMYQFLSTRILYSLCSWSKYLLPFSSSKSTSSSLLYRELPIFCK